MKSCSSSCSVGRGFFGSTILKPTVCCYRTNVWSADGSAAVAVLNSAPITTSVAVIATIATTSSIIMSSLSVNESKKGFVEGRDLPLRYHAVAIAAYLRKRPVDILIRSAQVMFRCSSLTASIPIDEFVGRKYEKEKLRAFQLVELITQLGPTTIKVFSFLHPPFVVF